MTPIDNALAVRILTYLASWTDHAVATCRVNQVFGRTGVKYKTQRSRLFLHRLREAGLVDGHAGRDGGIRRWSITESGRAFIASSA